MIHVHITDIMSEVFPMDIHVNRIKQKHLIRVSFFCRFFFKTLLSHWWFTGKFIISAICYLRFLFYSELWFSDRFLSSQNLLFESTLQHRVMIFLSSTFVVFNSVCRIKLHYPILFNSIINITTMSLFIPSV